MPFLNGVLQAVFGAAFGALYDDGLLHKVTRSDDGLGGFAATTVDTVIKALVESMSDQDRAAGGLPKTAVALTVLRAGLLATIDIDDSVTVGGATYRVIRSDTDPAAASFSLIGVPA